MNFITIVYTIVFFFGFYFLSLFLILHYRHRKELYHSPEPKKFLSVSFIVPAYNEEDSIGETLKAILKLDYPKEKLEVIVVNDGSKDKTAEIVRNIAKENPIIKLIDKANSGKADSINQALKVAKGELIAITDADSYPAQDSLKKMTGYFEFDKSVAAVTSRVLVKNKKNFIEKYQAFDYAVIAWSRKILDFIDSVYVTNGPLSVYRKDAVINAGGFDKTNLTEDIEITWNLLSRNYKTRMAYGAIVYTSVPSNFKKWNNQRIRWNLGGLQTIWKYKKYFFKGENLFGYFVMSYVALSFFLALVGILLFLRYLWMKSSVWLLSVPYIFSGYNPLKIYDFNITLTLLLIWGFFFFILAIIYYKIASKNQELEKRGIVTILSYSFIYRALYTIPLLISLYKLLKKDIRWYTK